MSVTSRDRSPMGAQPARLAAVARDWFELAERLDWRSYDPFDLLASPALQPLAGVCPIAARVCVRIGARFGARLRRVLRVTAHDEAQTLATFLSAAALLARAGESWARDYIDPLSVRLAALASMGLHGTGWGLGFPFTSRFSNAAAGEPNVYHTILAGQALLDACGVEQDPARLALAMSARQFVSVGLGTFSFAGGEWVRYWSGSNAPIVNVQALAASFYSRTGVIFGDPTSLAAADRFATSVVRCQRRDGSWPYSIDGRADFIDGFHSGFILQGLSEYRFWRNQGGSAEVDIQLAVRRGYEFYTAHLLTSEGVPRAFADGRLTLDGQTAAQAVQTLVVCGGAAPDLRKAEILWRLVAGRYGVDALGAYGAPLPALRWTIAPATLATAHLLYALTTAGVPWSS